ncbi:acetyltransferase (isoleucine patch superfamily)-like protein [[Leptolyngbya] sp. PCC 7376]|uniref:acyltransferase n=1 Tax=[Leptolyngbya] sp. PCC 7376 TaxID=111781 RepID=UPI00029F06B4|nr:DapH/DapD/GlmU-related protein [[Leptolyngbya] sp. PCC 7376]AFY36524.1 acetyltransferase (isoleucine patch superfamily)-like protein [[Leptolyngbya] sp. PCC 7376]
MKIKGKLLVGQRISIGQFSKILVAENSTLIINDDVWINDNCHIETCSGQAIKIGSKTTLQSRCQIRGDITIGENVLFAPNAFVSSGTHLYSYIPSLSIREQDQRYQENHGGIYSKPIIIGEDCWFGINVVILPGITIGNNCVIGANSVVTKNINTGLVSAGVPAKIIKNRFKET